LGADFRRNTAAQLASCDLSDEALDVIAQALQEHPTLTALDLSDNQLTGAGAETLVAHVLAPAEPGKKRRTASKAEEAHLETGNIIHLVSTQGDPALCVAACRYFHERNLF
jgi:hypothetical protein